MKIITLTKGYSCMVDDEDYEYLSQFKWYAKKSRNLHYAARSNKKDKSKPITIWMHRDILNLHGSEYVCDHIDGNSLDNRKSNLRKCTSSQNRLNCPARKDSSTGIKGVFKLKGTNNFYAKIRANGVIKNLGSFVNIEDAKEAYNKEAVIIHGEFARLN